MNEIGRNRMKTLLQKVLMKLWLFEIMLIVMINVVVVDYQQQYLTLLCTCASVIPLLPPSSYSQLIVTCIINLDIASIILNTHCYFKPFFTNLWQAIITRFPHRPVENWEFPTIVDFLILPAQPVPRGYVHIPRYPLPFRYIALISSKGNPPKLFQNTTEDYIHF